MSSSSTHHQDNSTTPQNPPCAAGAAQATPAFIKRQQFQQQFQSPTDNILSPCSKMLTDPVALMRQKQKPKLLTIAYANAAKQAKPNASHQSQQLNKENKEN